MARRARGVGSAVSALAAALVTALGACPVLAQQAGGLAQLGLRENGAELPGLGRVLIVLVVTLALAIAAIYGLRRYLPAAVVRRPELPVRLAGQLAVSASLKLHFVELERATLVVVESRNGVAVTEVLKAGGAVPQADGAARAS